MRHNIIRKTLNILLSATMTAACFLLLSGCGQKDKFEAYKVNMNQFFENIRIYDSSINALAANPDSDTAVSDLLSLLDSMDTSFAQMASLEVPDGFPGVAQLAQEASENMSQAVSYYHQAFEGEVFDESLADAAKQYYDRANLRIQYIVAIFQGNIPEEIYIYEDDTESGAGETGDAREEAGGESDAGSEENPEENFDEDEDYEIILPEDDNQGADAPQE